MAKYFDGSPLTPALLTELMGIPSLTVTDIEVLQTHDQIPGTDKSGRHSNITRVAIKTATPGPITHLIIKRVACPELSDRGAAKWNRDINSYRFDVNFYKYFESKVETVCRVPKAFHYISKHDAECRDPKQCWFYLILEDLESAGYVQYNFHDHSNSLKLLDWMARFHSLYWEDTAELKAHLWDIASAQSFEKRDEQEIKDLPKSWAKVVEAWKDEYPELFAQEDVSALGSKLLDLAPKLHAELQKNDKYTALLHGDFKSANLFLHKDTGEVAVVDYQWAGAGKVVRDLVYFMWGAVDPDVILQQEQELLAVYHKQLTETYNKVYPWEDLKRDYRVAFLDYVRHVSAYMWPRLPVTPQSCEKEITLWSRVVHNKSKPVVKGMIEAAVRRIKEPFAEALQDLG